MAVFLQIVLINLVVSCDNVGVIALATKGLPAKKAAAARRIGIWLSLLLKLLFVGIAGLLFAVPWLHIRMIGGALLLYVTFHMLRQENNCPALPKSSFASQTETNLLPALTTIVAADVSMSLDNVLALLSIVSSDGQPPDQQDLLLIFGGLLLCIPVLLWFSDAVSRLMERFPLFICLCGGYLAYIAVRMIFEDELMVLFFQTINFHHQSTVALLFGGLVCIHGFVMLGAPSSFFKRRSTLIAICTFVVIYSLLSVAVISYAETGPVVDGHILSPESLYEFIPSGANGVFSISAASHLPALCAAVYAGVLTQHLSGYRKRFFAGCRAMLLFTALELLISTVCFTISYGFGQLRFSLYLSALALQIGLLLIFVAVFTWIGTLVENRGVCTALCILITLLESIVSVLLIHHNNSLAGLLPSYYITFFPLCAVQPAFLARTALIISIYLSVCWLAGTSKRHHSTFTLLRQ